jgi:hypothetical protein
MKRVILVIGCLAMVAAGAFAAWASGSVTKMPPRPSWVRLDGTVDLSKVPARIPRVGGHGQVIGYVSKAELFGSPFRPGPRANPPERSNRADLPRNKHRLRTCSVGDSLPNGLTVQDYGTGVTRYADYPDGTGTTDDASTSESGLVRVNGKPYCHAERHST